MPIYFPTELNLAWYTIQTEYKLCKEYLTDTVKLSNQSWVGWELGIWNFVKNGGQQKKQLTRALNT